MRNTHINRRVVVAGAVLFVLAVGFFGFMLLIAGRSTDPVQLMRTVGMASGVVCGLSVAIVLLGLRGKSLAGPASAASAKR